MAALPTNFTLKGHLIGGIIITNNVCILLNPLRCKDICHIFLLTSLTSTNSSSLCYSVVHYISFNIHDNLMKRKKETDAKIEKQSSTEGCNYGCKFWNRNSCILDG